MQTKRLERLEIRLNNNSTIKIKESKFKAELAKLSNNFSNMLKKCEKKLSETVESNR